MNPNDPRDSNSIPGAAFGSDTTDNRGATINVPLAGDKSLANLGSRIVNAVEFSISSLTNSQAEPKYRTNSRHAYYGGGALSLDPSTGGLIFAKNVYDRYEGLLRLSDTNSTFYSRAQSTTVGSTDIKTVDGFLMNPAGTDLPSTPFSPHKTFIQQLIPDVPYELLAKITIIELIQGLLFDFLRNPSGTNTEIDPTVVDLGTIIVDREDEFL